MQSMTDLNVSNPLSDDVHTVGLRLNLPNRYLWAGRQPTSLHLATELWPDHDPLYLDRRPSYRWTSCVELLLRGSATKICPRRLRRGWRSRGRDLLFSLRWHVRSVLRTCSTCSVVTSVTSVLSNDFSCNDDDAVNLLPDSIRDSIWTGRRRSGDGGGTDLLRGGGPAGGRVLVHDLHPSLAHSYRLQLTPLERPEPETGSSNQSTPHRSPLLIVAGVGH